MFTRKWPGLFVALAFLSALDSGSSQDSSKSTQNTDKSRQEALEFLGSYSARDVITSTETGHVSAHPPSPPADRRLRQIDAGPTILPPWPDDLIYPINAIASACSLETVDLTAAETALKERRPTLAGEIYDRLAKKVPACLPLAWNRFLTQAYSRKGSALADILAEAGQPPSAAIGRLIQGLERLARGDVTAAREELATSPTSPGEAKLERDWLWGRALMAWAAGEPKKARRDFLRLLESEPDCVAAWFALGGVALEEGRTSSRRLAESDPESVWNRRLEADAVAARYPELSRRILSHGSNAEVGKGEPALDVSVPRTAPEADLERLETLPDTSENLYLHARAALYLSEKAYDRASRSPLFDAQFSALRALAAEQEDDEPAARNEYRRGLLRNPHSAILHAGLGHLHRSVLEFEAAERELSLAVRFDSADPVAAFELGDVYLSLGQPARAVPLLEQALRQDSGLLLARWSLAKAYQGLGDNRRAVSEFEAAAPADTSGELQWQLARLYQKLGRPDLAAQAQKRSEEQRRERTRTKD